MRRNRMDIRWPGKPPEDPRIVAKSVLLFAAIAAAMLGVFVWQVTRPPLLRPDEDRILCRDSVRAAAPAVAEVFGLAALEGRDLRTALYPDGARRPLVIDCRGVTPVPETEDRAVLRGQAYFRALPPGCQGRMFRAQIRWERRRGESKLLELFPELVGFALDPVREGCPAGPLPEAGGER